MRHFLSISLLLLSSIAAFGQEVWSIEKCIDHALENNIDLALQDKVNELTELQVKQSKNNFGPYLNGQIDYTQAFGRSIDPTTNSFVTVNALSNRYLLSSNIEVFSGLQKWNSLKKSKLQEESGLLSREIIAENIQLNILTTYLTILRSKEQLQQAYTQSKNTEEQLNRSRSLVEAGVLAENELITLEAQLATDNILKTTYENAIEIGITNLKLILRLDPATVIDVAVPELPDVSELQRTLDPIQDIYTYASSNRPEVKSAELARFSQITIPRSPKGPSIRPYPSFHRLERIIRINFRM